jgi:hypothetical protein
MLPVALLDVSLEFIGDRAFADRHQDYAEATGKRKDPPDDCWQQFRLESLPNTRASGLFEFRCAINSLEPKAQRTDRRKDTEECLDVREISSPCPSGIPPPFECD